MKSNALALPVLVAGQFLAGCDAQTGADYRGEPLLSITGSVLIQNENPPANLIPSVAFLNSHASTLDFAEVEVAGEFPARFTLDVFEPPPDTSIVSWEDPGDEEEPDWTMGFITAVSADHPPSVRAEEDPGEGGYSGCDASGCTTIDVICSPNGEGCYRRVTQCDGNGENCMVVEESGNPTLARGWLRYLAGLSTNYRVLYFPDGVKAATHVAYVFGNNQALAPGYHLVELAPFSPADKLEQTACFEAAQQEVLDRFNAEHGTQYAFWFDVPGAQRTVTVVARERGCVFGPAHVKLIHDPAHTPITVTIRPDVEPIPFF